VAIIYQNDLSEMRDLFLCHGEAEPTEWQGRRALKLNGLVIIPDLALTEGHLEVQIGADGAAYSGIAYRVADKLNYELAYAQPHTSNQWDALQYDPVFTVAIRGSYITARRISTPRKCQPACGSNSRSISKISAQ
jgi:hypothetical protein